MQLVCERNVWAADGVKIMATTLQEKQGSVLTNQCLEKENEGMLSDELRNSS
jgi:hypothetical protein